MDIENMRSMDGLEKAKWLCGQHFFEYPVEVTYCFYEGTFTITSEFVGIREKGEDNLVDDNFGLGPRKDLYGQICGVEMISTGEQPNQLIFYLEDESDRYISWTRKALSRDLLKLQNSWFLREDTYVGVIDGVQHFYLGQIPLVAKEADNAVFELCKEAYRLRREHNREVIDASIKRHESLDSPRVIAAERSYEAAVERLRKWHDSAPVPTSTQSK